VLIAGGVGIGFALSGSEGTPAASAAPSESSAGAATPAEGAVGTDADVGADDGEGVAPVTPITPSVPTMEGEMDGDTRVFQLTASEFTQQIANFPLKTAKVWGYSESTPGPTLLINEGEKVRVEITNELPPTDPMGPDKGPGPHATATTVHFHGLHHPNSEDGVAGISQPDPIEPGATYTYEFTPEHAGTFAYHSHTDGAVQDLRGLDGMIVVQPPSVDPATAVDVDVVMTLQQFAPPSEGALVAPFPPGTGAFPFSTINGKTSEAAGEAIDIEEGDRVRIRFYNASNNAHSMHLHGHDFVVTSKNGHPIPLEAQNEETTQNISPGDFYEIEWTADNPGNWIFHCHFPHHTANKMLSGWHGAPVGMARIFHYEGFEDVRQEYFDYQGPAA
jgi:FtsP/CotA-like multicopper oxidase with cupredoxin domain